MSVPLRDGMAASAQRSDMAIPSRSPRLEHQNVRGRPLDTPKQIGYTMRRESDRQDRFGVSEEVDSSDEGPGPFADGAREADEGFAAVRGEGALGRRQHILPDGGQVRACAPVGLPPRVEAHGRACIRAGVRADMKELFVSMRRQAPLMNDVRYVHTPRARSVADFSMGGGSHYAQLNHNKRVT